MTYVNTNINLHVIDVVTRGAAECRGHYVGLVTTNSGKIAVVGSTTEEGVVSLIATLTKQDVMDHWGDSPLTDTL